MCASESRFGSVHLETSECWSVPLEGVAPKMATLLQGGIAAILEEIFNQIESRAGG